ncbi:hypothetical protein VB711_12510 [Cronbergia sp. UHCC 0137]|uniref:hypothetical protein n=1 Tax=Cronbergia sp. UHCC 0137 TaxID=3110239 RepID=UPI002B20B5F7|nr:hypothetical protein [Cronbergia sp. UHCC 0137]MEA5618653.1 hypothetical protein [Cronbergia sp. UHCC 0137]
MSEATLSISITELIPMLTAIAERNWEKFKEVENQFVTKHGVEAWEEFFAFRLKPALDKDSDRWLLIQWCSKGIKSVKIVA